MHGLDFECSVFEWLDHSNTKLQNGRISNGFGIRAFGIQVPTVVEKTVIVELRESRRWC